MRKKDYELIANTIKKLQNSNYKLQNYLPDNGDYFLEVVALQLASDFEQNGYKFDRWLWWAYYGYSSSSSLSSI